MKDIILFAGKLMELKITMLSEISQTKKCKYCMFSLICRLYTLKMNDKNLKWTEIGGKGRREGGKIG
jgi:hypothetical protein